MKKILIAISIIAALSVSAGAQNGFTDGFFSTDYSNYEDLNRDDVFRAEDIMPLFPERIGGDNGTPWHQDADPAPLGSGLLLLAGMGLAYGIRKKKNN